MTHTSGIACLVYDLGGPSLADIIKSKGPTLVLPFNLRHLREIAWQLLSAVKCASAS